MKKILVAIFAIGIMAPVTAQAENWYVTADAGVATLNDSTWTNVPIPITPEAEFDPGFLLDLGVGYDFGNIRMEAVGRFQRNNQDNISGYDAGGDFTNYAGMFNGYFEFNTNYVFEPFITGGIGWAKIDANNLTVNGYILNEDDTVLAWQAGAGAGFALSDTCKLDVTYRYFATDDPSFGGTEAEVAGHNITIGFRFYF